MSVPLSALPNTAQIFSKAPDASFQHPDINSAIHLRVTARKRLSIRGYYEAGCNGSYPRCTSPWATQEEESAAGRAAVILINTPTQPQTRPSCLEPVLLHGEVSGVPPELPVFFSAELHPLRNHSKHTAHESHRSTTKRWRVLKLTVQPQLQMSHVSEWLQVLEKLFSADTSFGQICYPHNPFMHRTTQH